MDQVRLALSVKHLDVGIHTGWTSDRFRTLEFAALSLGLPFEGDCPTTAIDSLVIDDIVVIDREPLATMVNLLKH
ncbi:hypothetical protein JMJ58_21110 (plasmid) [Haloterrigena salifodinae]|uniref:Uncharacterized protein n=1 Tax=Haloterrigena salifodinae TaxID=2675099 RepID=A0A8T8E722_9EURY|nr:hypothetical protein JMJ58_21110 [Haloterrigena salifodinae]